MLATVIEVNIKIKRVIFIARSHLGRLKPTGGEQARRINVDDSNEFSVRVLNSKG